MKSRKIYDFSLIIKVFLNFFAPAAPFSPNWSAKVCGPLKCVESMSRNRPTGPLKCAVRLSVWQLYTRTQSFGVCTQTCQNLGSLWFCPKSQIRTNPHVVCFLSLQVGNSKICDLTSEFTKLRWFAEVVSPRNHEVFEVVRWKTVSRFELYKPERTFPYCKSPLLWFRFYIYFPKHQA